MSLANLHGARIAQNGKAECVGCVLGYVAMTTPHYRLCRACNRSVWAEGGKERPASERVITQKCVVALDLSYTSTGICVMRGGRHETQAVHFKGDLSHPGERLAFIFDAIEAIVRTNEPNLVVAERSFGARKGKGAANMGIQLGGLHGYPQALAFRYGAAFRHVDNAAYRSKVLGFVPRGDDVKGQIKKRLGLMGYSFATDDEADAWCMARYAMDLLRAGPLPLPVSAAKKKARTELTKAFGNRRKRA